MINRQNYLDVKNYLTYQEKVLQNDPQTIKRNWAHLRHLLEWADGIALPKSKNLTSPTFPAYLTARDLAPATIKHNLTIARAFFKFACVEWVRRYSAINQTWIDTLTPPRHIANARKPRRDLYTLEHILKIAAVKPEHLHEQRAQAGACMMYISGMRAGALGSLPISAVDLSRSTIYQFAELGVKTKNSKSAETYLLTSIPRLTEIVSDWDALVRSQLPEDALWYATLTRDNDAITATMEPAVGRVASIEIDIRLICDLAGIEYKSPHKLRHGHAVYALKRAPDYATWKAISQNMMHASTTTTDQIYGNLLNDDRRDVITGL